MKITISKAKKEIILIMELNPKSELFKKIFEIFENKSVNCEKALRKLLSIDKEVKIKRWGLEGNVFCIYLS